MKEVHFAQDTDIWVVGDLYGRLGTLWEIHRLWQARGQQPYVVGLGDMIDCGLRQLEVAAAMIAWRAMYPHKVSIVLGDHEHLRDMNSRYGFRCVDGTPSNYNLMPYPFASFYSRFNEFFTSLPLIVRTVQPTAASNAVFMHGGFGETLFYALGSHPRLDAHSIAQDVADLDIALSSEIVLSEAAAMCSDDAANDHSGDRCAPLRSGGPRMIENFRRGGGSYFNQAATVEFLKRMDACILMTGHSHKNGLRFEEAGSRPCGTYQHAVTLSAYNYHDPDLMQGMVAWIKAGARPEIGWMELFTSGYGPTLQKMDIGVVEKLQARRIFPEWPGCGIVVPQHLKA